MNGSGAKNLMQQSCRLLPSKFNPQAKLKLWFTDYLSAVLLEPVPRKLRVGKRRKDGSTEYEVLGDEAKSQSQALAEDHLDIGVELVQFRVIVAIRVLQTGNALGAVLNFKVGLQDLDVHLFAFSGTGAGAAGEVERLITIVSLEEFGQSSNRVHDVSNVEEAPQSAPSHESLNALRECSWKSHRST